jgi:hypothetical protein
LITAAGAVNGSGAAPTDAGIYAKNYGGNLKIYGVGVSGGRYGIDALNQGSGELYIKTKAMVTGSGAYGINGVNYSGTSLTINAASVTGAVTGIGGDNTRAAASCRSRRPERSGAARLMELGQEADTEAR